MGRKKNETLACFVQALQGMQVIVELRYDTALRGVLESVDDAMNLVMTDVKCQPLQVRGIPITPANNVNEQRCVFSSKINVLIRHVCRTPLLAA
jgi:small nuclear ribonucleoprotein (snRNP)-like protein